VIHVMTAKDHRTTRVRVAINGGELDYAWASVVAAQTTNRMVWSLRCPHGETTSRANNLQNAKSEKGVHCTGRTAYNGRA